MSKTGVWMTPEEAKIPTPVLKSASQPLRIHVMRLWQKLWCSGSPTGRWRANRAVRMCKDGGRRGALWTSVDSRAPEGQLWWSLLLHEMCCQTKQALVIGRRPRRGRCGRSRAAWSWSGSCGGQHGAVQCHGASPAHSGSEGQGIVT